MSQHRGRGPAIGVTGRARAAAAADAVTASAPGAVMLTASLRRVWSGGGIVLGMHITSRLLAAALILATACSRPAVTAPSTVATVPAQRAHMIAWLQEYNDAGQFPLDAQGWPLSVFRDERGVRCPMAELIYRSGRGDLVDAVATTDNALRLADVHDGPLAVWMADSGLTRDEIVMIQGAANIPLPRAIEVPNVQQLAAARGRVQGRLDTATVVLRDHTREAIKVRTVVADR